MASSEVSGSYLPPSEKSTASVRNRGVALRVWLALGAILVLYVFNVLRAKPISTFGVGTDDALYFSSAKAIAAGQGYVLPGFPGHLPSMKYPELYPLLLAGVWKLDPTFPGNVALAVGLSVASGCLALMITFLLLQRWPGLGDWPALGVVFLISLYRVFVYQSAMVASDISFMALLLGAAWLAERSFARESGTAEAVGAGVLAGMSVGLRSLGISVAVGIGLLLLCRRRFRRLLWFCLTALPLTMFWTWPTVRALPGFPNPTVQLNRLGSGWAQTVCYYSSYGCFWKSHVPNVAALRSTVVLNLWLLMQWPGEQLLGLLPAPLDHNAVLVLALVVPLSAVAYMGVARHVRAHGWRPLPAIFLMTLPVIIPYPFNPRRFLLPFAPLLFAGLWVEGGRIATLIGKHPKRGSGWGENLAAGFLVLEGLAIAGVMALNFGYASPRLVRSLGLEHQAILNDESGAFAWLQKHAAPDARVIAYEDGLVYLHTGRPSVRSIFCISEAYYVTDPRYLRRDGLRLGDVARHIGASYWLTTPYDFPLQSKFGRAWLLRREKRLLVGAPAVYRGASGNVTLYDVRCLFNAAGSGCADR